MRRLRKVRSVVGSLVAGYKDVYTNEGREEWLAEARRVLDGDAPVADSIYDFYRSVDFWPTATTQVTEARHDSAVRDWLAHEQVEGPVSFEDTWLPDYWADAAD